ncbi:MAG: metallophosphoesterase family protein [Coriobacteriia bacterium]|nr:metallophosphoesterase family protein [Coriobacteriia bacterium]
MADEVAATPCLVGLLSDTHGVLDERVAVAFEGVEAIIHAGDVCAPHVLRDLESLAPVTAVAGNCDHAATPGMDLDYVARTRIGGVRFLVIHDFSDLGPIPEDVDVVVCGHSHVPRCEWHGCVLVVNPGSSSQRRRQPSRTVGVLEVRDRAVGEFRLIPLDEIC